MRVLVACEYSGVVRDAFRARGHDAWSCDLLPTEADPEFHIQGDVLEVLDHSWGYWGHEKPWDLMIAHPPCTALAVSGSRWFPAKRADGSQQRALEFVQALLDAPIPRIALENPISIISSHIRKPDQIIQPWMFGHPETKATCLWLKGLPKLAPTDDVREEMERLPMRERARVHHMAPGPDRWKDRSRTLTGIAAAMAGQWG